MLRDLAAATAALLVTAGALDDAAVAQPSRLPGWTRGHVLTHLARNAEGGTRLLRGARTGEPAYEYESLAARSAAIEAGANRPAAVLAADVRATAGALAAEADTMPPDAWERTVRWTAGQQTPATMVASSRLAEVLIHHVDLDFGYQPAAWPPGFVTCLLPRLARDLAARTPPAPAARLVATGTGWDFAIGDTPAVTVHGPAAELLGWLLGRSPGDGLARDPAGPLPAVPAVY